MSLTKVTYSMINGASVNVLDFGATGDGTTDDTAAFQAALAALENGGVLYVPLGRYKITDTLVLTTGVTVQGQGSGDRTYGIPNTNVNSSYIFQTTASKSVFSIGGNTRQTRIKDISLGSALNPTTTPSATINGIVMSGTYPNSSQEQVIERCCFYNFNKAVAVQDTNIRVGVPDWQCDSVSVNDCQFWFNTTGLYLYTTNADEWVLTNCSFYSVDNGSGINFQRSGTFTFINCFGGGTLVNSHGILISGDGTFDTIKLINCQWEAIANMIYVQTSYYPNQLVGNMKIILDSCQVEAPITLEAACHFISFATRYTQNVNVTGNNVLIDSYSDYFMSPSYYLITGTSSGFGSCIPSTTSSVPNALNGMVIAGSKQRWDSVAPTGSGPFNVGDITWNSGASLGENVGWMCIASGTPGTWQPFGQIGSRSASGSPIGVLTPYFLGEEYLDTDTNKWYKSIGATSASWVALN